MNAELKELKRMAYELRRAIEIFAKKLVELEGTSDSDLMEIPRLYPKYDDFVQSGQKIKAGLVIQDGVNAVGDPQLYRVVLDTMPSADKRPAKIATSFLPVGLGASGFPIWAQPLWYLDAYDLHDKVDVGGVVYISTKASNMTNPGTEGAAWVVYTGEEPQTEPEQPQAQVEVWKATGLYALGALVSESGKVYESLKNENWDKPSQTTGTSWKYLYDL